MRSPRPLPDSLGARFSVQQAASAGVNRGRLRRADLAVPFRGVRSTSSLPDLADFDTYERQAAQRRVRAKRYAPRMRPGQFFSHESAVALLGGPLPLVFDDEDEIVDGMLLPVHVSTLGTGPLVRANGVIAHRADPRNSIVRNVGDFWISSPATTWAQLGHWSIIDLVALGDCFCRVWRPGPGRPGAGSRPFTTISELRSTIAVGRRVGIRRLREAVDLIREDSWSPRESKLRCHLVFAGLPEPVLNHDVYDDAGRFLGCVDLAYPERKVAIEYQSVLHASRYAADVERIAALRAAGWTVIEVTADLFARTDEMIFRIRRALAL